MDILVKGEKIVAVAENISYGIYDEPIPKWRISDAEDKLEYYALDDDFILATGVDLPEDYEEGKYFYDGGIFYQNPDFVPYESAEEKFFKLQNGNLSLGIKIKSLEEQLSLSDETAIELYESQVMQDGIIAAQDEAIIELYELLQGGEKS